MARLTFDSGVAVISVVLFRSGLVVTILTAFLFWQRQRPFVAKGMRRWQLALGLLITIQSIALYIAVATIPVGIALLFGHTFAILLALLTWALGGPAPSRTAFMLMLLCLLGLFLSLDTPQLLAANAADRKTWLKGISAALTMAVVFSLSLWITEHKLHQLSGTVRSLYTTIIVFICSFLIGQTTLLGDGFVWPTENIGWLFIVLLSSLYALGFVTLFVLAPRLNMARNAPALHIEPVASLALGWIILGQRLTLIQMVGGLCVIAGIILLAVLSRGDATSPPPAMEQE